VQQDGAIHTGAEDADNRFFGNVIKDLQNRFSSWF
jgi:hypothetical protein